MGITANARSVRISGYLAAFLPGAAIYLSSYVPVLHRSPLALSFLLIAAISRTFDRGPSILAPIITALFFNYVVAVPAYGWAVSVQGLVETSILLMLGFAIAYLFQDQRDAEQGIRSANKAL